MPVTNAQLNDVKDKLRACSQEQLLELNKFVNTLYKSRRSEAAFTIAQEILPGARVRLKSIRPARLEGKTGTVVRSKMTKVVVKMDDVPGF